MKRKNNSYLFPVLIGALLLVPALIALLHDTGFISDEAGLTAVNLMGIVLAGIIVIGAILKATRMLTKAEGGTIGYKIAIFAFAILALILRFNRVFDWF